jgi:hypothetical protein
VNPAQGIRSQFTEEINVWKEYSSDKTSGARTATNSDRGHLRVVAKRPCLICAGSLRTSTTCDLRKPGRSDARPAMSSPFPCVGGIIAKFIVAAMNQSGGATSGLIRWLSLALYGGKVIQ